MERIFLTLFSLCLSISMMAQEEPHGRYLFNQFKVGIGKMKVGRPISDNFNYDVIKQEMHFMDRGDEMKLEMPGLDTLYIDKREFVQSNGKFAEVFHLSNGMELQVFWHSKEMEKGKKGANGITTQAGGVYSIRIGDAENEHVDHDRDLPGIETYNFIPSNTYIVKIGGKPKKFSDAKSLAKALNQTEDYVKAMLRDNDWSLRRVKDVIQMLSSLE